MKVKKKIIRGTHLPVSVITHSLYSQSKICITYVYECARARTHTHSRCISHSSWCVRGGTCICLRKWKLSMHDRFSDGCARQIFGEQWESVSQSCQESLVECKNRKPLGKKVAADLLLPLVIDDLSAQTHHIRPLASSGCPAVPVSRPCLRAGRPPPSTHPHSSSPPVTHLSSPALSVAQFSGRKQTTRRSMALSVAHCCPCRHLAARFCYSLTGQVPGRTCISFCSWSVELAAGGGWRGSL